MKAVKVIYDNLRLDNEINDLKESQEILSNQDISLDLVSSLCGRKIGEGLHRKVYEYNLNEKYVIKLETANTSANMTEYFLWDEIQGLTGNLAWVKDWFAPVKWISPNGKIIVMQKTEEKPGKPRPTKVPAFFSDLKYNNWGWIGNKFVCHDYGFIHKFIKYENKFQTIHKDAWW